MHKWTKQKIMSMSSLSSPSGPHLFFDLILTGAASCTISLIIIIFFCKFLSNLIFHQNNFINRMKIKNHKIRDTHHYMSQLAAKCLCTSS